MCVHFIHVHKCCLKRSNQSLQILFLILFNVLLVIKIILIKQSHSTPIHIFALSSLTTSAKSWFKYLFSLLFLPPFFSYFLIFLFPFLFSFSFWLIFRSSPPKWKHLKYTKYRESEWWTRNFFINKSAAVVNININLFIILLYFDLLPCII